MPPPPPPPPGPPLPPPPPVPMGIPAAAMDKGRTDLMASLKGMSTKRMLKPVPRREKKHFNMIEMLKAEEKKKKGGIGVASSTAKSQEKKPAPSAASKPSASELLAVKLRRKEPSSVTQPRPSAVREAPLAPMRCSTTDDELEALFSAIDKEITDDPEAAVDLLDIIEDHDDEEMPEEMAEEIEVIRSNIYLPPEDDYEMMVEETEEDEEDAEMREMMEMIENAKGEIESSKEEELVKMMDKIDDDEYFAKMKDDIKQAEMKNASAPLTVPREETIVLEEPAPAKVEENDANKNKRRADETVPEKEPSKKKTKDANKKKKVLAAGGVSMFGGKDLFGGKNPFASRKQEQSSEEEEVASEDEREIASSTSNGTGQGLQPPPPPPQMPSFNLAVQADSEEQPVSFDDLPSSTHVILSTNKHRAKIPSRRRPTGRGQENGNNGHIENGNGHIENSNGHVGNGNGHDRLALPVR